MSTVIKSAKIGYFPETSYGVRVLNGSTWRRFGLESGSFDIPQEKSDILTRNKSSSYDPDVVYRGNRTLDFSLSYAFHDPRELYYALGQNTTGEEAGSIAAPKTHTMTANEPANAFTLPSRTIHLETSEYVKQIDCAGCITQQIDFSYIAGDPRGVMVKEYFVGQRITDDAATHNLYGQASAGSADLEGSTGSAGSVPDDFSASTHLPSLRGGAAIPNDVSNPLLFWHIKSTNGLTIAGTDVTRELKSCLIRLKNNLEPIYCMRSGKNNYNVDISRYPAGYLFSRDPNKPAREYSVLIECYPNGTIAELINSVPRNDIVDALIIDFQRSDSDNSAHKEWLKFTFDTAYCPVTDISGKSEADGKEYQFYAVGYMPGLLESLIYTSGAGNSYKYTSTLEADTYATYTAP